MGGINIYCGLFRGEEKSGSAFEGVLAEMETVASAAEAAVIARLKLALNNASDHIIIQAADARLLQPLLRRCHESLDSKLVVPGHPFDQMARDEAQGGKPTALKYGAARLARILRSQSPSTALDSPLQVSRFAPFES